MSSELRFRKIWAGAILVLLALSYRLWIASSGWAGESGILTVPFPRVPMVSLSATAAFYLDALSLVALVTALATVVLRSDSAMSWRPMLAIAIALSVLFVSNQHRLQPWAYQGWLYAVLFAGATPRAARRYIIVLTISIYAFSAMGKFDQQFLKTVGPGLVNTLIRFTGMATDEAHHERLRWLIESSSVLLPIAELTIAGLLVFEKTRRIGGFFAIVMHLSLLVILGPIGLGHSAAVLAWNLFLAVQAWLLFVRRDEPEFVGDTDFTYADNGRPLAGRVVAHAVLIAALILPVLERRPRGEIYGYWDHWLSWSLYSPHTSRVEIQVHESAFAVLPEVVSHFSRPGNEDDGWSTIQVDRWSLAELAVPVYPQARFQLGVAHEIALQLDSRDRLGQHQSRRGAIRVKIRGVSDRKSGRREEVWAIGADGIANQRDRFWLLPHQE